MARANKVPLTSEANRAYEYVETSLACYGLALGRWFGGSQRCCTVEAKTGNGDYPVLLRRNSSSPAPRRSYPFSCHIICPRELVELCSKPSFSL